MALKIQRRSPGVAVPRYKAKSIPTDAAGTHGFEVGSAIAGLGKDVSRFTKAMKVTRQNMELAEVEADLFVEFEGYEDSLRNETDYKRLETEHPDYVADVQKRFSEKLSHDSELQAQFEPYLKKKIAVLGSRVRAKSRGLQIDEGRAKYKSTFENLEYGTSSLVDETRKEAMAIGRKTRDNAVNGGLITRQEAQADWDSFTERSEMVRAQRSWDVDPEKTLIDLKARKFDVSPEKNEALINACEAAIKQKDALEKTEIKELEAKKKEVEK